MLQAGCWIWGTAKDQYNWEGVRLKTELCRYAQHWLCGLGAFLKELILAMNRQPKLSRHILYNKRENLMWPPLNTEFMKLGWMLDSFKYTKTSSRDTRCDLTEFCIYRYNNQFTMGRQKVVYNDIAGFWPIFIIVRVHTEGSNIQLLATVHTRAMQLNCSKQVAMFLTYTYTQEGHLFGEYIWKPASLVTTAFSTHSQNYFWSRANNYCEHQPNFVKAMAFQSSLYGWNLIQALLPLND